MLNYTAKLTSNPGAMNEDDLKAMREAGLTNHEISMAAQVISYFNYINRIADGLGVDLEDWMPPQP